MMVPVMRVSRSGEHACRVELHHLHVAQRQAEAQRHGEAVHALVARGRVIAVHGRPAAGGEQHGLGLRRSGSAPVRTSIISTPASDWPSLAGMSAMARCSSRRRMAGRAHTCSISRLMISMPVRSPLCTVRSKVWPAKALPCSEPSELRSKKQPTSFSSSRTRSTAVSTSVQASSWLGSHLPPSMVSMKWRSTESPGISETL